MLDPLLGLRLGQAGQLRPGLPVPEHRALQEVQLDRHFFALGHVPPRITRLDLAVGLGRSGKVLLGRGLQFRIARLGQAGQSLLPISSHQTTVLAHGLIGLRVGGRLPQHG